MLFCYIFRSADNTVHLFDRRKLTNGETGSPVHKFVGHNAAVLCVQVFENVSAYFLSRYRLSIDEKTEKWFAVCQIYTEVVYMQKVS